MLSPVQSPDLAALDGVTHGFFTRQGGVSFGCGDLNCGPKSDDAPEKIAENRARVATYLGGSLEGVSQFHSADVLTISSTLNDQRPAADAIVTNVPGLAISVLTADCGPILFCDSSAQVIGAAHSGWKGTVGQIGRSTIQAMQALGATPENIVAVLGPTIARQSYEVGPGFETNLVGATPNPIKFLSPSTREGHWMFDLPGLINEQLADLVGSVNVLGLDTYALEDQFFSFRRATHRQEPDYGRQISGICLNT